MAITFNGNNYFSVPVTGPNCEAAKTVFFRAYFTSLAGTQGLYNATDGGVSIAYQFGVRSNLMTLWNFGGGFVCSFTPTLNVWQSICYTYNPTGTVSTFYVNGLQVATSTTAVNTGAVTQTQIGGNQWGEALSNLMLEDLRIYSRILTVNEIIELSNNPFMDINVYGLSYWWPMTDLPSGLTLGTGSLIEVNTHAASTLVATATPYPVSAQTILTNLQPMRV